MLDESTRGLQSAMGSLPELLEKKKLVGQHTNVATTLLAHIKRRQLDVLFESEEKLLNGQPLGLQSLRAFFFTLRAVCRNFRRRFVPKMRRQQRCASPRSHPFSRFIKPHKRRKNRAFQAAR